ncbi:MAG: hypothetical protein JOZ57_16210, partial [Abitibacteriaceae bacterium]|nr:hypothetical protein [Abditibacteriaceae bacterium]
AQRLAAALTLDTLIIPKFTLGPDGAPTGVTLRTAKQAGFTQATLNTYIQTLINAKETVVQTDAAGNQKFVSLPVVRVGDRIFNATLKVGNQTFTSPVFQHADGTFGFNSVLFVVPGASEVRQVPSTQAQTDNLPNSGRVTSVIVNRNPYDGHVHYEFTLAATAGFDAQTGDVTLSNAQAVVDLLGPFIKVLSGPTAPTVTQVAASIAVRDPKKCRDAESDAVFTCDEDGNPSTRDDDPWTKEEKNRLKVCGKSKTGSPGGTTG